MWFFQRQSMQCTSFIGCSGLDFVSESTKAPSWLRRLASVKIEWFTTLPTFFTKLPILSLIQSNALLWIFASLLMQTKRLACDTKGVCGNAALRPFNPRLRSKSNDSQLDKRTSRLNPLLRACTRFWELPALVHTWSEVTHWRAAFYKWWNAYSIFDLVYCILCRHPHIVYCIECLFEHLIQIVYSNVTHYIWNR